MVYSRDPYGGSMRAGWGLGGPVPRDLWILLGTVFGTFTLQFFASTAWFPALLRLSPALWQRGFVWQPFTYPFAGTGAPDFWFLLELFILFLFGRDVLQRLGRRGFWVLLVRGAVVAAVVAVVVQLVLVGLGAGPPTAFALLQGQHMLLVLLIAAFATINRRATIYLFFVLPIEARWFLGLEILFAFLGFLGTRDLAGFLGICAGVGFTYLTLVSGRASGIGRELWLRIEQGWIRLRLAWLKRRRGLRVVRGDKDGPRDPWVH